MTHTDGVVTVEIVDSKAEDSGEYRCVATNKHGTDETSCVVIVEGLYSDEIKIFIGRFEEDSRSSKSSTWIKINFFLYFPL